MILYENKGEFLFKEKLKIQKKSNINLEINIPCIVNLPGGRTLKTKIINQPKDIKTNNSKKIYISKKYLSQNLFVRSRKEGDKIFQIDDKTKTRVKKILSNHKNKKEKENILIFSTESEIIWILGIRQSVNSYVNKNDEKVIELSLLKNSI